MAAQFEIGIYSWWRKAHDNSEFVVINFIGFQEIEIVEIVEYPKNESRKIQAKKFLESMQTKKIIRITK